MATNFIYNVRTDKDSDFTGALAQNAIATANITAPGALSGVGGNCRNILRTLLIQSDQNLDWEVWLFSTDDFEDPNIDLDSALGWWSFSAASAVRIAGAGQYYYYIDGLGIAYNDADFSGEIHLALVNRSAASKNAGATGEIVIQLGFEVEGP